MFLGAGCGLSVIVGVAGGDVAFLCAYGAPGRDRDWEPLSTVLGGGALDSEVLGSACFLRPGRCGQWLPSGRWLGGWAGSPGEGLS